MDRDQKLKERLTDDLKSFRHQMTKELNLPECMPWVVIYLVAACLVFLFVSKLIAILLLVNATVSLVVGMVARGQGKDDKPAVLLGLLLGPVGALAGMIAARPGKP